MATMVARLGLPPGPGPGPPDIRLPIAELNPLLICRVCGGYLVDATTITECVHTFCRSCLVKHLEYNVQCPVCHVVIHPSNPYINLKPDIIMQDIVSKLLPQIEADEKKREREFYKSRNLPCPFKFKEDRTPDFVKARKPPKKRTPPRRLTSDHLVTVELEFAGAKKCKEVYKPLVKPYMLVPGRTTVGHFQRFISAKLQVTTTTCQVVMFMDTYLLHESLSLDVIRHIFFSEEKEDFIIPLYYGVTPIKNYFDDLSDVDMLEDEEEEEDGEEDFVVEEEEDYVDVDEEEEDIYVDEEVTVEEVTVEEVTEEDVMVVDDDVLFCDEEDLE